MKRNQVMLCIIVATVLPSALFAAEDAPVRLLLKWQPGQTLRYKLDLTSTAHAQGQQVEMGIEAEVVLRVLDTVEASLEQRTDVDSETVSAPSGETLSSGEEVMDLELIHYPVTTRMRGEGQRITVTVGKNDVSASVNGRSLSGYQLRQLRNEMKPLQDVLNSPIRLRMTRSGQIVRVSGLDDLDPETRRQMAMSYFESFRLPTTPLRIGEHYLTNRNLDTLAPGQNRSVEISSTLKGVQKNRLGRPIAQLHTPVKLTLDDVTLDEEGTRGAMDLDVVSTLAFDVDRGTFNEEITKGKMVMRPRSGSGLPGTVTVDLNASFVLVEMTEPKNLAQNL